MWSQLLLILTPNLPDHSALQSNWASPSPTDCYHVFLPLHLSWCYSWLEHPFLNLVSRHSFISNITSSTNFFVFTSEKKTLYPVSVFCTCLNGTYVSFLYQLSLCKLPQQTNPQRLVINVTVQHGIPGWLEAVPYVLIQEFHYLYHSPLVLSIYLTHYLLIAV